MSQETPADDSHAFTKCAGIAVTDGTNAANTVGSSLDHLIGTWTQAEADEMDAALKQFETVDGIAWTRVTAGCEP